MHLNNMSWNPFFMCVEAKIPQTKTSKYKLIPLCAGRHRHVCFFTNLGDRLALCSWVLDDSETPWFHPEFHDSGSTSAGTKIGTFLKAVMKKKDGSGSRTVTYENVAVSTLPEDASAAGFRHGCADELVIEMPGFYVVQATGHDLKKEGSIYEYTNARLSLNMPSAAVLHGWPAFEYNQNGKGPRPASLGPILVSADRGVLEDMIDSVFSFHSRSPPHFRRD